MKCVACNTFYESTQNILFYVNKKEDLVLTRSKTKVNITSDEQHHISQMQKNNMKTKWTLTAFISIKKPGAANQIHFQNSQNSVNTTDEHGALHCV